MEKKEKTESLTNEQMKDLLSMYLILPDLLKRIENLSKKMDGLSASFAGLSKKYNDVIQAIQAYQEAVEQSQNNLVKEVDSIIQQARKAKAQKAQAEPAPLVVSPSVVEASIPAPAPAPDIPAPQEQSAEGAPVQEEEPKDDAKEFVDGVIRRLVGSMKGRDRRSLRVRDLVNGFDCSEEQAELVLKTLEKRHEYNPATYFYIPKQGRRK